MLNVLHISDFHREWSDLGLLRPMDWNINILQHPTRYRVDVLPEHLKLQAKDKIEQHMDWLKPRDSLTRATNGYQGIINFMMQQDNSQHLKDFFKTNNLIDSVRKEDFFSVFPELGDLKQYEST
jgi:hypothetical protein